MRLPIRLKYLVKIWKNGFKRKEKKKWLLAPPPSICRWVGLGTRVNNIMEGTWIKKSVLRSTRAGKGKKIFFLSLSLKSDATKPILKIQLLADLFFAEGASAKEQHFCTTTRRSKKDVQSRWSSWYLKREREKKLLSKNISKNRIWYVYANENPHSNECW